MNPQLMVLVVLAVVLVIGAGIYFQQRNGKQGAEGEADVDPPAPDNASSEGDAGNSGSGDAGGHGDGGD